MLADYIRSMGWWRATPVAGAIAFAGFNVTAQTWSNMFPGDGHLQPAVNALAVHNAELYQGGEFGGCMNRIVNNVARWDAHRWAGVGAGLAYYVYALVEFDDPNTPEGALLFAGAGDGVYQQPDDPNDPNEPWPLVGGSDAPVRALAVFEGALYAGGEFTEIGGEDANYIARWNGTAWEEVGGGVGPDPNDANSPPAKVLALTVFDGGGGEALFAGGTFLTAGGLSAKRIARFRDGTWSALVRSAPRRGDPLRHRVLNDAPRPLDARHVGRAGQGPLHYPGLWAILRVEGGTRRWPLEDRP